MKKRILIDANFPTETRVALLDKHNNVESLEFSSSNNKEIKSNIYLAKIVRVEPSLQAAFIDYGDEKNGFLPFSEIPPEYFNIPANKKNNKETENIASIEINEDRLAEEKFNENFHKEDISAEEIEHLIDNDIESNFNIEADENDLDIIASPTKKELYQKYKIQEVIKKGQILLVQATKEERGSKGASFTGYISLAGRYCVLMPNRPLHNGVSKKIYNNEERKRLKSIIKELVNEKQNQAFSLIIRTAGAGHTNADIKKDYEYLAKLWNKIRETTLISKAPSFIHQEDDIILRTIRDMFDRYVKEIVIQGDEALEACKQLMSNILPSKLKFIKEYKNKTPIFTKFNIEEQLINLYKPIVQLPSGGYVVINPTEAMVSIDVNSGRSTSEKNIEETALKTNLEAAKEIAKQLKLRDLSGLVVIDFIDLSENKHKKILERSVWEYCSRDSAKIQVSPISNFGLLELSRQRLRPTFLERNSDICNYCSGKGIIRADESNSMLILRTIENEVYNGNYSSVNVYGIASSIVYLLNNKREEISFIEQKYNIKLNFYIDSSCTADSYSIEKVKSTKNKKIQENNVPALKFDSEIYNEEENNCITKKKKISNLRNNNSEISEEEKLEENKGEKAKKTKNIVNTKSDSSENKEKEEDPEENDHKKKENNSSLKRKRIRKNNNRRKQNNKKNTENGSKIEAVT